MLGGAAEGKEHPPQQDQKNGGLHQGHEAGALLFRGEGEAVALIGGAEPADAALGGAAGDFGQLHAELAQTQIGLVEGQGNVLFAPIGEAYDNLVFHVV